MPKPTSAVSANAIATSVDGMHVEPPAGAIMGAPAAAAYLNLSPASPAKMRCWGGGPVYIRLGRKIGYMRADLDSWLNAHRASTTSDAAGRLPSKLTIDASNMAQAA